MTCVLSTLPTFLRAQTLAVQYVEKSAKLTSGGGVDTLPTADRS